MRLLITGGAGFIGSHLTLYLVQKYPSDQFLNLDFLTYAANPGFLNSIQNCPNYAFEKGDIADRAKVRQTVRAFKPEGVIHLAAESHVDNSILGPELFVRTNVCGTFNLLDECRQLWSEDPKMFATKRFHHVSTDEVYGSLGDAGFFLEDSPYQPRSPYSATKAGSDHLVHAFHHTYGMNITLSNCSNNYGPHQHDEKLIPTVIRSALACKPIPIYGAGTNVRDWLYVEDHCSAIDLIFRKGQAGEQYNIGSRNEWKNKDLVQKICNCLDELAPPPKNGAKIYGDLISFVKDRPGHDFRYAIDPAKIEGELGWKPRFAFDESLKKTISWYMEKYLMEKY